MSMPRWGRQGRPYNLREGQYAGPRHRIRSMRFGNSRTRSSIRHWPESTSSEGPRLPGTPTPITWMRPTSLAN